MGTRRCLEWENVYRHIANSVDTPAWNGHAASIKPLTGDGYFSFSPIRTSVGLVVGVSSFAGHGLSRESYRGDVGEGQQFLYDIVGPDREDFWSVIRSYALLAYVHVDRGSYRLIIQKPYPLAMQWREHPLEESVPRVGTISETITPNRPLYSDTFLHFVRQDGYMALCESRGSIEITTHPLSGGILPGQLIHEWPTTRPNDPRVSHISDRESLYLRAFSYGVGDGIRKTTLTAISSGGGAQGGMAIRGVIAESCVTRAAVPLYLKGRISGRQAVRADGKLFVGGAGSISKAPGANGVLFMRGRASDGSLGGRATGGVLLETTLTEGSLVHVHGRMALGAIIRVPDEGYTKASYVIGKLILEGNAGTSRVIPVGALGSLFVRGFAGEVLVKRISGGIGFWGLASGGAVKNTYIGARLPGLYAHPFTGPRVYTASSYISPLQARLHKTRTVHKAGVGYTDPVVRAVTVEFEIDFRNRIAQKHQFVFRLWGSSYHKAILHPEVSYTASTYSASIPDNIRVSSVHTARMQPITGYVSESFTAGLNPITQLIRAKHEFDLGEMYTTRAKYKAVFNEETTRVRAVHRTVIGVLYFTKSPHYSLVQHVTSVSGLFESVTHLLERNPVSSSFLAPLSIESGLMDVQLVDWAVYSADTPLSAVSFDIKIDEGDFAWSGSITLGDQDDYVMLRKDDPITLYAGGEVYSLIVDGKARSLGEPTEASFTIHVVSPSAIYDAPRADNVNKVWSEDAYAKDIASENMPPDFEWRALNWPIPAYRFGVENVSPLSVVKSIADAIGAVVETHREGGIYVRPTYKHTTELLYQGVSVDYLVDDSFDVYVLQETYSVEKLVNRIRVRDVEFSYRDRMEWVSENGIEGYLRAYPSPYRPQEKAPVVTTSSADRVQMSFVSEKIEEVEEAELVEFYEGEGSTSYPIHEIVDIEWQSKPLLGLVFDSGSSSIQTTDPENKFGLARIRYKTRYHEYEVAGKVDTSAQFLMLDTENE